MILGQSLSVKMRLGGKGWRLKVESQKLEVRSQKSKKPPFDRIPPIRNFDF